MAAFAVTPAHLADVERLAWLSHSAKLTYRRWAAPGWAPPDRRAEAARWERRLRDHAGSTLIAHEGEHALGAFHLTDARAQRGEGQAIAARAHLSGLCVDPSRWGEGIGSCLHDAVLGEACQRGYRGVELLTAAANLRSRTFYDARGWRLFDDDGHEHDGLWLVGYERLLASESGPTLSRCDN
jgi:RimJ/RimL family protein N-acetyltransferase